VLRARSFQDKTAAELPSETVVKKKVTPNEGILMPVCPNGCVDSCDDALELEFGYDQNRQAAYICGACGYRDLQIDLCAA